MVSIVYANSQKDALDALINGYEPIECSFGKDSVVGAYFLDHHGLYSNEDCVAVKAAKLVQLDIRLDKFVVTGTADCDQCYAIAALSGPKIPIVMEEAKAISELDVDPIGRDLSSERYQRILLFNQNTNKFSQSLDGATKSLDELIRIYNGKYKASEINVALKKEVERKDNAKKLISDMELEKIALVVSEERSFDVWYSYAPIVVQYFPEKKIITLGLCPKKGSMLCSKSGFDLLGFEGLASIYPLLDKEIKVGWGGRESVGGSPRNIKMQFEDAVAAFNIIKGRIKKGN